MGDNRNSSSGKIPLLYTSASSLRKDGHDGQLYITHHMTDPLTGSDIALRLYHPLILIVFESYVV
jgi:hypothetical protein